MQFGKHPTSGCIKVTVGVTIDIRWSFGSLNMNSLYTVLSLTGEKLSASLVHYSTYLHIYCSHLLSTTVQHLLVLEEERAFLFHLFLVLLL